MSCARTRRSVGRLRWTSPSMCSTACWSWDAQPMSASPEHVGVGVSAPTPLIHATKPPGLDRAAYHTQPDQIGLVAREARAKALVMSHLMPGSDPEALRAAAREHYAGPVVVGEDLMEV